MNQTWNWQEDKEYYALIEDLLEKEEVQKLKNYTHHHFSNRLAHSIHVSYVSYQIAAKLNLDVRSVARAGLLHDMFYYDWRETEFEDGRRHSYMHPRIALQNARKITEINDLEADIILKHMFGATLDVPKYAESWIVSLVDDYTAVGEYVIPKTYMLTFKAIKQFAKFKKFANVFVEYSAEIRIAR